MPFAAAAAAVGAGGAIIGADNSASAYNKNTDKGISALQNSANQAYSFLQPYNDLGQLAQTPVANASGLNGAQGSATALADFQSSPGYDYQVQQGLRAVDAGAASKGLLNSGATIKAEQTLGTNLANQSWNQYLGQLNTLVGVGQNAANTSANVATTTGSNMASLYGGQAKALASIYGQEAQSVTNSITGGLGSFSGKSGGSKTGIG